MPTFKHAWVIERALASLFWQDFEDWELVLVDDGSPDDTRAVVTPYLTDPRVRYHRLPRNSGLGAALNYAGARARGRFLAYLPSDDLYHPGHLSSLVATLDDRPDAFLAYSGVRSHRHWWGWSGLTLHGDADVELQGAHAVGREEAALRGRLAHGNALGLTSGNLLALAQVMHRRPAPAGVRWTEREQYVSDTLEAEFWSALLDAGCTFASTGRVTCEWTDHPDQRHKIIAEAFARQPPLVWPGTGRGLAAYRQHYGIPQGAALNWQPSLGPRVDESVRYRGLDRGPGPATDRPEALGIHLVGELGFNPERILALEQAGHRLSATWIPGPESWDAASTLPVGGLREVPWGPAWAARMRETGAEVIYALLNVHAVPLVHAAIRARPGIPVVFHLKESPQRAMAFGLWSELREILRRADGLIFISQENLDWHRHAFPGVLRDDRVLVLDGDLPKADWMTHDWSPRLSDADGAVHTVSVGRPINLRRLSAVAGRGVHVHLYGTNFHAPDVTGLAREQPNVHLHATVEPADWVSELSRYDAAWVHDIPSDNGGDVRAASWSDLNLPARLGTCAAAGLPWLVRGAPGTLTAVGSLAETLGVDLRYDTVEEVLALLADRRLTTGRAEAMRRNRTRLTFDHHVPMLEAFFHRMISGSIAAVGGSRR
ncbi:glycosyltransferase [Micromonospora schwarzwaldensis]